MRDSLHFLMITRKDAVPDRGNLLKMASGARYLPDKPVLSRGFSAFRRAAF